MKRNRPSFRKIAEELISMYTILLGQRGFAEVRTLSNLVARRLSFLSGIVEGKILRNHLSLREALDFYEALLDGVALQYATMGAARGVFDPLCVGDPALLGRQNIRRADLKKGDEFLADWHFERLVQATASAQGFSPVADLKYDGRFKGQRVCDFALPVADDPVELLEVKRVHPALRPDSNQTTVAAEKVLERLDEAIGQLENTARVLGASHACKHALFDVSAYAIEKREVEMKTGPVCVVGFSQKEINEVHDTLVSVADGRLRLPHKITLCSQELVFIDGKATAIIQHANSRCLVPTVGASLKYDGWTVEGYPIKSSEYAELRVSSTARSLEWIKTTYNNCSSPETFFKIGQVERRPK